ncbi:uncharacterized protein LOC107675445 [Sinocyclocheilus anshuiensis]|uniref:uncharacterized protein LOC107675445 n=1 Tax=Sinocyclocheilus anshuiensis TaxID=1608454 RepID=UPI0007BA925E|nr:PREDICTED: uncharacterized protein LOC107675445 [Sinocyclocheilus anshuiensis]
MAFVKVARTCSTLFFRHLEDIPSPTKNVTKQSNYHICNSTELVIASSPDFVTELLPSAQRTALLYHLSYLCLANFPKLERELRERAVETQLLFGSSEVLLLKCVLPQVNLVTTLLPALKVAVEKDKSILAIKSLKKARAWITEIVDKVEQMVERYDKHNHSVASCTSDVINEKAETEGEIDETTNEIEALKKVVSELEEELKKNNEEIRRTDETTAQKNRELQNDIKQASRKRSIPDPVHLNDVQTCLTRIQQILIQIKKFWESVSVMLEALKDETFANDHFIEDGEMKEIFLESITTAQQNWKVFGESCLYAKGIFSLQTKDAFKFLEISPSSLPPEEWKKTDSGSALVARLGSGLAGASLAHSSSSVLAICWGSCMVGALLVRPAGPALAFHPAGSALTPWSTSVP